MDSPEPRPWTDVSASCVLFRCAEEPDLVLAVPRRGSDHLCLPGGKYQYAVPLNEWQRRHGWIGGAGVKRKLAHLARLRQRANYLERTAKCDNARADLSAFRWAIEELDGLYHQPRSST